MIAEGHQIQHRRQKVEQHTMDFWLISYGGLNSTFREFKLIPTAHRCFSWMLVRNHMCSVSPKTLLGSVHVTPTSEKRHDWAWKYTHICGAPFLLPHIHNMVEIASNNKWQALHRLCKTNSYLHHLSLMLVFLQNVLCLTRCDPSVLLPECALCVRRPRVANPARTEDCDVFRGYEVAVMVAVVLAQLIEDKWGRNVWSSWLCDMPTARGQPTRPEHTRWR